MRSQWQLVVSACDGQENWSSTAQSLSPPLHSCLGHCEGCNSAVSLGGIASLVALMRTRQALDACTSHLDVLT